MKKSLIVAICLIFMGSVVHGATAFPQTKTGDRKLDSLLRKINKQAEAEPEVFIRQLSQAHNIPEDEIRQAKERQNLSYGDAYMASSLSRISKRPIGAVAEEFKKNQGRGWGAMAMSLGIKPGSPEFKQMKANARGSLDHMKTTAKATNKQQQQEMERERELDRKTKDKGQGQGKDKKK